MKKLSQQQGFTLVELAIVLTIIGLLIGGILKGQQLMQNARVTSTIAQVSAVESATTTFRDTYNALPGDMLDANTRLANCTPCDPAPAGAAAGAGDNIVGAPAWALAIPQQTVPVTAAGGGVATETVLFWAELSKSGLLSGVNDDGITAGRPLSFGGSHPSARVGGGWLVGNSDGQRPAGATGRLAAAGVFSMSGTILSLANSPTAAISIVAGQSPLTPTQAKQMDTKIDDGLPNSGTVQAYGTTASCYNTAAASGGTALGAYSETINRKDCGLYIGIQR